MSSKDDVTSSEGHREIRVEGDYFEYVAGDVYTGTVIVQRNGREIRLPLQRPPRPEHFIGREKELTQLLRDLQPGHVVTLCGPGGIGKSALAAEAVWRLTAEDKLPELFSDGVIWHDFYREPRTDVALENIARVFGEEPKPTATEAAKRALSGKRVLVLLDGTEDVNDLPAVLSVVANCGVIVTSRKRKDAVADRQDLQSLHLDEAVKLLHAWGKEQAADETAVRRICELVSGLPLAVRLAGWYIHASEEPATEYLEWLEETPLDALDQGERKLESVPLLLKRNLEQVSESARQVLAVSGVLAFAPFRRDVIAAVLPNTSIRRLLNELVSYGLVLRSRDRYKVSHALIHTYARQGMATDVETIKRLAVHYDAFAREQKEQGLEGYARLDAERVHLMRIIENCKESKEWQAASDLVEAIDHYLDIKGYWTERQTALEAGVRAARNLNNRRNESSFLGNLGTTCRALGQMERAIEYHEQALAISREIGGRQGEGNQLGNLGIACWALGQMKQAIEYFEQALAISREIGDQQSEGNQLGNLGAAYRNLGQVEQAGEYYKQALAISREIGDRQGEGIWLSNLGNIYRVLGQIEQASEYFEQALIISQEIIYREGEAAALSNLGNTYYIQGQMERAIERHEQALAINREIGNRQGEGVDLGNLGNAYHALKQVEQAVKYHKQSLAINREIGNRRGEGMNLGNLGMAYRDLGQVERAIEYFEQALTISQKIGDRQGEGTNLDNLGNAYSDLGQLKKAIEYYKQALAISREIGHPRGEGIRLYNLGETYKDLNQLEKAKQYLQQAVAIFEEIKSPHADQARRLLEELEATSSNQ